MNKKITMEGLLRADFVCQRRFKCKEYFGFALEVYQLALKAGVKEQAELMINQSMEEVMESLKGWQEDP
jgi:hypothetical protein